MSRTERVVILMADDDEDDRLLTREALREVRVANELRFVHDGEELMEYLERRGPFSAPADSPRPGLILLDLNMPRMGGREALGQIKTNPELRSIPIVVLTTTAGEAEILRSYELGANSFITKPVTFAGLVEVMRDLGRYWLEIVELPDAPRD